MSFLDNIIFCILLKFWSEVTSDKNTITLKQPRAHLIFLTSIRLSETNSCCLKLVLTAFTV